ncbi:MAG: DUF4131 domain-containing protein [Rhodobacteraceae bacterium]|nr:DUF4131 domain-containing protein [Paracoccaceae bacterium]
MRLIKLLDRTLLEQRGHLLPWAPVFLGAGIGVYFLLRFEPGWPLYCGLASIALLFSLVALWARNGLSALGWAVALMAIGLCLAGLRAHHVAGPVLSWRYYGPIEGRVVALDRSSSDALRVTLDQIRLKAVADHRRPERVRISLHGNSIEPSPGSRVMTTGHLMPPQGPAEPGGFDFRRHVWFQQIGAVGYTRNPVLISEEPNRGALLVFSIRMAAAQRIRAVLPGEVGGFAAAVTTGDRSGVDQQTLQNLRDSNLAHLLAISGLHMGLLAGFVFGSLRISLSLIPFVALRVPVKRVAAVVALAVASGYLLLSGGSVATERAFVMVAVALGAVMVDRRALSLRAVAIAALIVLVRRPETLISPGFQMSFAATTALVGVFEWLRRVEFRPERRWMRAVAGVVISSAVAGAATGPIGAAHFNTMAHYGLLANLLSVPLMGVLVMPAAVTALCLWPLGLGWIGLELMGLGLGWILWVAETVAGQNGAVGRVVGPSQWVLPLVCLGFLFVILWQGRLRFAGLFPVVLGFGLWSEVERPAVLVEANGALVGVMTDEGRALSKAKGAGFTAKIWLENDGDDTSQQEAAQRWGEGKDRIRTITVNSGEIVHVIGKRAAKGLTKCDPSQVIVATVAVAIDGPCQIWDPKRLAATGSLAFNKDGLWTAQDVTGDRLWTGNRPQ